MLFPGSVNVMEQGSPAERWDRRWARRNHDSPPAAFVVALAPYLPRAGTALDVAGGTGRHAIWLAQRGFEVTLVDASRVALDAAAARAEALDVELRLLTRDLEAKGLPPGTWDVVLVHHFLDRDVLAQVPGALRPGGVFAFCQPTVRNLDRHERPARRFLLDEGEMAALVEAMPLDVLLLEEGWGAADRHEARLVARKAAV